MIVDSPPTCGILGVETTYNQGSNETVDDDIICTYKIVADRKTFFLDLKANSRGQVVRITEKVSSNRDRIMVPVEILDEFIEALQDIRNDAREAGGGDAD